MSSCPGFPRLLPTASGFPLSQLPPGQALTALNGAKTSTTSPPSLCLQLLAGSADFALLFVRILRVLGYFG